MSGLDAIDPYYVKDVLFELDTEKVQKIYEKLKKMGVKTKEHLKYVKDTDLVPPLDLIQARILIERWDKGWLVHSISI